MLQHDFYGWIAALQGIAIVPCLPDRRQAPIDPSTVNAAAEAAGGAAGPGQETGGMAAPAVSLSMLRRGRNGQAVASVRLCRRTARAGIGQARCEMLAPDRPAPVAQPSPSFLLRNRGGEDLGSSPSAALAAVDTAALAGMSHRRGHPLHPPPLTQPPTCFSFVVSATDS